MTYPRIRIRTASRLHFGLLGWGPEARRQFGGIGLMIDAPGIELTAEPAAIWNATGPYAQRVDQIVSRVRENTAKSGLVLAPACIHVESVPPAHVGLGVGTQLSLGVARALLLLAGHDDVSAPTLARWTGRGQRSGVGLHGFEHGGLIVDGGRKTETEIIPPLLARLPFPEEWSILVVRPPAESGLSGPDESRAFATLPPISQAVTDSLCRLVLLDILPAVIERDLTAFGAAIGELQTRVGACFAPVQGGIYSTAGASRIVDALRSLGFVGVGQSSWGPTLYAFSSITDAELGTATTRLQQQFGLDASAVYRTRGVNRGARVDVELS